MFSTVSRTAIWIKVEINVLFIQNKGNAFSARKIVKYVKIRHFVINVPGAPIKINMGNAL